MSLRKQKSLIFWHHRLFVNMPITKKDKALIENLFTLEYNNAKKSFLAKIERR